MRNFTKSILILLFTHIIYTANAQSVTVAQGNWTDASTWAGGVIPTDANSVTIHHAVVVNGVAVCKNLDISAMGSLVCGGSDVLTIGDNPLGGNATLHVDGSFSMTGATSTVFLRGNAAFGANSSWTMSSGYLEIDGNNGVVANSVADGTSLLSLAATATKNITGGTIRFNDPHAVTGNLMIDGASDFLASVAIGTGLVTDTNTPFAFGDNINFTDVNVDYVKNTNNMVSFGLGDIVKGNFAMTQGGLLSSTASKFEGNIACEGGVVEGTVVCEGLPTLISGSANFSNATLQSSNLSASGHIKLENNIRVNNLMLHNSIELNGSTLWVVGDISGSGMIILNNDEATLKRSIAANKVAPTVFNIGTSSNNYTPVTIANTKTTAHWEVKILFTPKATPSNMKGVLTQWDIKPSVLNAQADITVQWDEANEEAGFNRASCALHHWNGTSWDMIPPLSNSGTAGTTHSITKTGWSNYSPFAVFSEASLPVDLVSFTGRIQQGKALLSWETASEKFNDGFEVERSFEGENFEKIGFVKSTGNTQVMQYYNFLDYNAQPTAYYRLKQVDTDGSFNYSRVITLTNDGGKGRGKTTIYAYPNPVSDALTVRTSVSETSQLEIVDVVGRVVYTQNVDSGTYQISTTDLVKGIYIVRLTNRNEMTIQKIIKN